MSLPVQSAKGQGRSSISDRARTWPSSFGRGEPERDALLVLSMLDSVTPRRVSELAREVRTARRCLAAVRSGRAGSDADRARLPEIDVGAIHRQVEENGARIVTPADDEYPIELEDLVDPPALLFARGDTLPSGGVAVVGSRSCSALGRELARSIGRDLAQVGIPVVSGAARGIDSAAHEGALEAGGPTVAVLGCGIDRPYPSTNRRLIGRIEAAGTVVSEYPPGAEPLPFRFPARNRIIAALARAVVIVEGESLSGSLITADHALDLGRTVFAVPGAINSSLAEAPLKLLRDGATPIRGAEDLLEDLGLTGSTTGPAQVIPGREVLAALSGATLPEEVAARVGSTVPDVLAALTDLEVRGLVRQRGGRFEATLTGRAALRTASE